MAGCAEQGQQDGFKCQFSYSFPLNLTSGLTLREESKVAARYLALFQLGSNNEITPRLLRTISVGSGGFQVVYE